MKWSFTAALIDHLLPGHTMQNDMASHLMLKKMLAASATNIRHRLLFMRSSRTRYAGSETAVAHGKTALFVVTIYNGTAARTQLKALGCRGATR
jgi:hypothetical protein